jgi:DNA-binding NtrC family response regulator
MLRRMTGGRGVLVVDDDASIRMLCRINLELEGHDVREAATLGEARDAVAEDPPAVVLLDLQIGTESGWDLLTEIHQDYPDVRVVLLTGTVQLDRHQQELADGVLPKPFSLEQLASTVRRLAAV